MVIRSQCLPAHPTLALHTVEVIVYFNAVAHSYLNIVCSVV